jgi:diguanylate cyclase (GGDEF)-like protein
MAIAPAPLPRNQGFLELLRETLPIQDRALELYQRLLAINDLASSMNAAKDVDQIQNALTACFREWMPQDCISLCILDGTCYRRCRIAGPSGFVLEGTYPSDQGLTGTALGSGTALWAPESVPPAEIAGWIGETKPGSAVILPFIALGKVVGALELISLHPKRFDQVEYHLSFLVAAHLSSSLENVLTKQELASANARLRDHDLRLRQLNQELQLLAHTDDLTGLHNKRRLLEQVNAEIARARRYGEIMSCLMIDVDHFKLINDSYGHQAGDEILRQAGPLLRQSLRVTDFVARYGGEEFTVLLPRTDAVGAFRAAENLRIKFSETPFHIPSSSDIKITISIGIASCTKFDRLDAEQVILQADTALYQAKRSGRNQICLSDEFDSGPGEVNILAGQ